MRTRNKDMKNDRATLIGPHFSGPRTGTGRRQIKSAFWQTNSGFFVSLQGWNWRTNLTTDTNPSQNECNKLKFSDLYENQLRNPLCMPQDAKITTRRACCDFPDREKVFSADEVNMVYSMYDRMIVGGAMPVAETLRLEAIDPLKAPSSSPAARWYFQRRRPRRGEGRRLGVRTRLLRPLPRFGRPRGDLRARTPRIPRNSISTPRRPTATTPTRRSRKPTPWWLTWARLKDRTTVISTR